MRRIRFSTWRDFATGRSGNVAMMFAMVAFPMFLAIGFAVDYSQATKARSDLQNIADAVALTAVRGLVTSEEVGRTDGTNYYEAAMQRMRAGLLTDDLTITFETLPDFKAYVEITATARGAFGNTIALGTLRFEVDAEAILGRIGTEVAMVLDYSGSMDDRKFRALGQSVRAFQTTLDGMSARSQEKFRLSVVPFARSVSLPADVAADWLASPDDRTFARGIGRVCATATDVERMTAGDAAPVGDMRLFTHYGDYDRLCIAEQIMPLSANRARLNTIVSNMTNPPAWRSVRRGASGTAYAGTRVFDGATWALRTLHPDWAPFWPAGSKPARLNQSSKFMLIMTDGDQKGTDPFSRAQADRMLRSVCEEASQIGATVYTVAFRAPRTAQSLLQDCATSDVHYIRADNETALQQAFEQIAREIGNPIPRLIY